MLFLCYNWYSRGVKTMKNTLKLVLFTVIILLSFNIKLNAEIKNIKSCSYKLPNNNGVTVDENDYKKITISFKYDTENPKKILYYFWADGTQKNISYDYNTLQGMLGTPVKYNYWSENDYIYAPALTNVNIDNFSCPILHASYQNEGIVTDCKSTENNGNAPHNYTCPQNSSGIILKSTANLQLWEQKNFFDVVLCEDDKCSGTEFSKKDNLITCSYYGYLDEKSKTNTNLTVLKMVLYKENDEIINIYAEINDSQESDAIKTLRKEAVQQADKEFDSSRITSSIAEYRKKEGICITA